MSTSTPSVVHVREPEGELVKLGGVIDERFEAGKILAKLAGGAGPVVFDLEGVPYITSSGVREWMAMLAKLGAAERTLFFVRARPGLANQFNMIARFGGDGVLVSMYCPYVCTECSHELEVLFDRRRFEGSPLEFAQLPQTCPVCHKHAELDDLPEVYFAHVASAPRAIVPPSVSSLIDGKRSRKSGAAGAGSGSGGRRFSVSKEVVDELTALWLFGVLDKRARLDRAATGLEGDVLFLFDGIELIAPEGLLALTAVLNQPGVRFHLARVPWAYLAGSLGEEVQLGRTRLVSLVHPSSCKSCGAENRIEIDRVTMARIARGEKLMCSSCMELTDVAGVPEHVKKLPLKDAPRPVRAYLDTHADASAAPSLPVEADASPLLLGKYRLLRRLGAGGMSEVFLCSRSGPEGFEKPVVIKKMLPHLAQNDAFIDLFLQEARMAARITHSNVVQIFDLERSGSDFYIAMEYVPGWDLNTIIKCCRALGLTIPVELAVHIALGICAGLQAAHSCTQLDGTPYPIVHRDISPHNVLLSRDGEVKVADFGIAKAKDSRANTQPGDLKGKANYIAPEVIDGKPSDVRADIFAAGLVLYLMLTLKHPFDRKEEVQTLLAVVSAPIPAVRGYRTDVSAQLEAQVMKALSRDPQQRHASARDLKTALEDAAGAGAQSMTPTKLVDWLRAVMDDAARQGLVAEHTTTGSGKTGATVTTPGRKTGKAGKDGNHA